MLRKRTAALSGKDAARGVTLTDLLTRDFAVSVRVGLFKECQFYAFATNVRQPQSGAVKREQLQVFDGRNNLGLL